MSINISNWNQAEHVAWSLRNSDKLFSTHTVKKGTTTSLPQHLLRFDEFRVKDSNGQLQSLSSILKATETDGLIVLHNGKIVFETYDRSNTNESMHIVMSMTKGIAGLVAGILVQQGKLNVNNAVSVYTPEVIGTPFETVSVRDCLDMRAGLQFDNADLEYRKASGLIALEPDDEPIDLHSFLSTFRAPKTTPVDGLEGATLDYLSINADLIGWVLERASGNTFSELLSKTIWKPMGAESDALITVDPGGNARTSGGLCATLRDMARIGQLLIDGGRNVVPSEWIDDMIRNGSREAFETGSWQKGLKKDFKNMAYRSLWLADSEQEILISLGIYGQLMIVDRLSGIVMVHLCSQSSRLDAQKKDMAVSAFKEFRRILIENETVPRVSKQTGSRTCGCTVQ